MNNLNLLIVIIFSTILINVSGYKLHSTAIQDETDSYDQEPSSTITDSAEVDQPQLTPESSTSTPEPPPPPPKTTTTLINPDDKVDENRINYQDVIRAKLIARSNNYDHKEDKNHRSIIVTGVDAYQLPSNDLLIRTRTVASFDWIVPQGALIPKLLGQQQQQLRRQTDDNKATILNQSTGRVKRQADVMTMNQNQVPGGMDPTGQQRPSDPNVSPIVARFRQFVNRMRDMITEMRDAINGNRVNTNVNGPPTINNSPQ